MTALDVHEVADAPPPAAPAEIESSEAPNDYRADLAAAFRASTGRAPSSDAEDQLAEVADQAEAADDPAPPSSSSAPEADQGAAAAPVDERLRDFEPAVIDEALELVRLHQRAPQQTAAFLALKSGALGPVPPQVLQQADAWFSQAKAYSSAERSIATFEGTKDASGQPKFPDFARVRQEMGRRIEKGSGPVDLEAVYKACGGKVAQPPAKRGPTRAGSYHDTLRETLRAARRRAP